MTGYTVHTGASKKFVAGWDRIVDGDDAAAAAKKPAKKKSAKKKAASPAAKKKAGKKKAGKSKRK